MGGVGPLGPTKRNSDSIGSNILTNSAFATYVLSILSYTLYLSHVILPDRVRARLLGSVALVRLDGSSACALLVPAWLTVAVWYVYLLYLARNLSLTPPVEGPAGLRSLTDPLALIVLPPEEPSPPPSSSHDQHPPSPPPSPDRPIPILRDLPCQVVDQFYFRSRS